MSDWLFKLRLLYHFLIEAGEMWWGEVGKRDLDERFCCDGRMCGCYGESIREVHRPMLKRGDDA